MASATKDRDEKAMATTDLLAPGAGDDGGDEKPRSSAAVQTSGGGFFTIYKKGQGYWTRMGTAIGAAFLLGLTLWNIYVFLKPVLPFDAPQSVRTRVEDAQKAISNAGAFATKAMMDELSSANSVLATASAQAASRQSAVAAGIVAALGLVCIYLVWRLINKPANVDFLIATDSEMKKVNWTSRKDLIGSTKVVIVFMFFIATFLALADLLFSFLFEVIGVLKNAGHTIGGG